VSPPAGFNAASMPAGRMLDPGGLFLPLMLCSSMQIGCRMRG
jgi:hypothetical protein